MSDPFNPPDNDDPAANHPARARRANVMLVAIVERPGAKAPTRHRVRDLSTGGIRIDDPGRLQPGMAVLVTIGALQAVHATITWVRDGFAGLAFANAINVEEARARAAIAAEVPVKPLGINPPGTITPPTAGWMGDMRDRYRK